MNFLTSRQLFWRSLDRHLQMWGQNLDCDRLGFYTFQSSRWTFWSACNTVQKTTISALNSDICKVWACLWSMLKCLVIAEHCSVHTIIPWNMISLFSDFMLVIRREKRHTAAIQTSLQHCNCLKCPSRWALYSLREGYVLQARGHECRFIDRFIRMLAWESLCIFNDTLLHLTALELLVTTDPLLISIRYATNLALPKAPKEVSMRTQIGPASGPLWLFGSYNGYVLSLLRCWEF